MIEVGVIQYVVKWFVEHDMLIRLKKYIHIVVYSVILFEVIESPSPFNKKKEPKKRLTRILQTTLFIVDFLTSILTIFV